MSKQPTRTEIENARHTRAQLAEWGISWPPPKGWRKRLLRQADQRAGTRPTRRLKTGPRTGRYEAGEPHRAWPEWTFDGDAFVRTR